LTGWIPGFIRSCKKGNELISLSSFVEVIDVEGKKFNVEREWKRMYNGYKFGDCLINISTGDMNPQTAEQLGLVPLHAYAGESIF
jgi:calpain-7